MDTVSAQDSISPILMSVLANRMDAIVREMTNTLLRAGRSAVINIARDFSCAICTADSEVFACAEAAPVHIFGVHNQARAMLEAHPNMKEGDAFLDNDPYAGNSHAADHAILVPVFFEDEHLFTAIAKSHQADAGNSLPTTYCPAARDVYEEGALIFPAVQVQREYTMIEDIVRMCRRRIRVPTQWYGDFLAAIGAARVAERRLKELCEKYGKVTIKLFVREWLDYSEKRMAEAIGRLPAAEVKVSAAHDPFQPFLPDGVPLNLGLKISPVERRVEIDLTDNLPNLDCGLNLTEGTATASVLAGVFGALGEGIPQNAGSFRRVSVKLKDGCIVGKPKFPHSCSVATTNLTDRLTSMTGRAFSHLGEGHGMAEGGVGIGISAAVVSGRDPESVDGAFVNQLVLMTNGGPATPFVDGWVTYGLPGANGLMYRDSIEIDELKMPIRYEHARIAVGSCGAGRFRGGPALDVMYGPTRNAITIAYLHDGQLNAPAGARGGHPGSLGESWKIHIDGTAERLPATGVLEIKLGEKVRGLDTSGGGYGDPMTREPEAVLKDVREKWETVERAAEVYGVVLESASGEGGFKIDVDATAQRRRRKETV